MLFILIGGASASGKTSLATRLLGCFQEEGINARKLNMDDYFKEIPEGQDIEHYRNHTNFDTPEMLDWTLLKEHLSALNRGQIINKPLFSFRTNRREGTEAVSPCDVVIMEGIFALYCHKNHWPEGQRAFLVSVTTESYLDILARRAARDTRERGFTPAQCIMRERSFVGPGFFKFTAPSATRVDIHVVNTFQDGEEKRADVLEKSCFEILEACKCLLPSYPKMQ